MKKLLVGLLALAVLAGLGLLFERRLRPEPWTTESPEALAELEAGLENQMKFYRPDAVRHFRRALELDPEFTAARVMLHELTFDREERERLVAELRGADRERLTARERFLVEHALARADRRLEEADRLVTRYLEENPGDPYGLAACSEVAWAEQDWRKAETHYRRLLERDPNWVAAQNHLGYMAMAQGRFDEAEELFVTYKYIAPDQANPHDSLGELLTILGRYEEARHELEEALEIKPDFCASYQHLLSLASLMGLPDWSAELPSRSAAACGDDFGRRQECELALWRAYFDRRWDAPFEDAAPECEKFRERPHFLIHRMAVLSGRAGAARDIEEAIRAWMAAEGGNWPYDEEVLRAFLLHMSGVRAAGEGDYAAAAELLGEADGLLFYWGGDQGILKLFNRLNQAAALELAGRGAASAEVLRQVEEVNPAFAEVYPWIRDNLASGDAGRAVSPAP